MPLSEEILQKIKRIQLKTNFLSSELFTGEYESAFKGIGMSFEEVRDYVPGDDVRLIDWNVTARTGKPHLKVFRQERERSLIITVDASASMAFGAKRELAAEVAAVLATAAVKSHDKVGLLLFSDRVERFIPPKKGRSHVWQVIQEILSFEPEGHRTQIECAATHLRQAVKRRSICVFISDFLEPDAAAPLKVLRGRHEVVLLRVVSPLEREWPALGLVRVRDLETGGRRWVDVSRAFTSRYRALVQAERDMFKSTFGRIGIDAVELEVGRDYVQPLMALFRRRERRRR